MLITQISLDWSSLVTGAIGGLIAGVLLLAAEYLIRKYEKWRDRKESNVVRFKNQSRQLTSEVFSYLAPGASIEMMRTDLGPPNRRYETEAGIYSDEVLMEKDVVFGPILDSEIQEPQPYVAYLYIFKNATVKIITIDDICIEAISVFSDATDLNLPNDENRNFNSSTIDADFLKNYAGWNFVAESIPGCSDSFDAITFFYRSNWSSGRNVTFFICHDELDYCGVDIANDLTKLHGAKINGVCISSRLDSITYLYNSEIY